MRLLCSCALLALTLLITITEASAQVTVSEHVVGDRGQADYRAHHHQVVAGIYLAVCYYVTIVEVDYQRDRVACIR
mgnify:CR=1 FL=1